MPAIKIYVINQTGKRLLPGNGSKYCQLANHFMRDPRFQVVNQDALTTAPEKLPYFERDLAAHTCIADYDSSLGRNYFLAHQGYFTSTVAAAQEANAIPVLFANPHEFTLGMYVALATYYQALGLLIADQHLDTRNSCFSSPSFLRYGIEERHINPRLVQHLGSRDMIDMDPQGKTYHLQLTRHLLSKLSQRTINHIMRNRQPGPINNRDIAAVRDTMLNLTVTGFSDRELDLAFRDQTIGNDLCNTAVYYWERVFLFKSGVWVDLDHPGELYALGNSPILLSLDTDVSSVGNRSVVNIVRHLKHVCEGRQVVGVHIAEQETPLAEWEADETFGIVRDIL